MGNNPFEILQLSPEATPEQIVRQGARLAAIADEETRNRLREAVRELTGDEAARQIHAMLAHPQPSHESVVLERFQSAFRRPPVAAPQVCPPLDREEYERLLLRTLAEAPPPAHLEPLDAPEPAEEIERQTAEALWHSLPADPRG